MELRQIGQSKVSVGGQSMGARTLPGVHQRAQPGSNNAAARRCLRRCIEPGCTVVLLRGHQSQVQAAVLSWGREGGREERGGGGWRRRGGTVSKMHGMRWKVNSDTETQERGETKGGGVRWECVISQMKDFHVQLCIVLRCSFVLIWT